MKKERKTFTKISETAHPHQQWAGEKKPSSYPAPRYLEACAEGRLLMLAPFPYQNEKLQNMRQRCLQLNAYAMEICKDE